MKAKNMKVGMKVVNKYDGIIWTIDELADEDHFLFKTKESGCWEDCRDYRIWGKKESKNIIEEKEKIKRAENFKKELEVAKAEIADILREHYGIPENMIPKITFKYFNNLPCIQL